MFGDFKVSAEWMSRKNDNPILTPADIQNLIVATGGNLAAINSILGSLQINAFDIDTMRGLAGPTDTQAYHLGASWRLWNGTLYGVYNWAKDSARSAWATQDAKAQHFGVGYIYDFSKRTQLYTDIAWMNNSDQARASLSSAGYTTGWTTAAGEDARAIQLGIRHYF